MYHSNPSNFKARLWKLSQEIEHIRDKIIDVRNNSLMVTVSSMVKRSKMGKTKKNNNCVLHTAQNLIHRNPY